MRLKQWLEAQPYGTRQRLLREEGIRPEVLWYLEREARIPTLETAVAISRATRNEVTVAELLTPTRAQQRLINERVTAKRKAAEVKEAAKRKAAASKRKPAKRKPSKRRAAAQAA